MKNLAVFCSGKPGIKEEYIEVTKQLMKSLDNTKIKVAYGGGNVGLMGVVREAFIENGGTVISSNVHRFVVPGIPDDYLFENITDRQAKLVELGDMFLLLPGGYGSIYEILQVIVMNQIGESSKDIIIFNYNGVYDFFIKQIEVLEKEGFIKHELEWYKIKVFSDYKDIANFVNNQ